MRGGRRLIKILSLLINQKRKEFIVNPSLCRGLGFGILVLALAACTPSTPGDNTSTSPAAAQFPLTVNNCGREVTIPEQPTRVIGIEGAAETLFALGAEEQTVGYFGSSPDSLPDYLAEPAGKTEYLGSSFPFPTAERVLENSPDLVVLYGFGDSGDLAEQLDAQQIPYLLLSETCDTPDPTIEGYFTDVKTIATALGHAEEGVQLVEDWKSRLPERTSPSEDAPKIVVYGNTDPSQPFVSGGNSFVQGQIDYAGGVNAYADQDMGYLTPSWEDIASRKPDIILSGAGGGEETRQDIENYLMSNAALAQMPAVMNHRIVSIDYAKNVPGPQSIEGILEIREAVENAKTGS